MRPEATSVWGLKLVVVQVEERGVLERFGGSRALVAEAAAYYQASLRPHTLVD